MIPAGWSSRSPLGVRRLVEHGFDPSAPGETPLVAARRELAEETGLDPAAVLDRSVPVDRDVQWNGHARLDRMVGSEVAARPG
ncbi:NUDIX domain-containing protein [Streptomyces sp. NPDC059037]|uniref:NUDIX domain-containing protein n=1 Tax=Streptomyces sp. NPDC059037 TaxID=3346710 RepID=UPI00368716B7